MDILILLVVVVVGFFVYQGWRFVCLKVDRARIESIRRETLHDGSVVLVYGVAHGALLYEHFANEPEPTSATVTPVTKPDEVGALAVRFIEASIAYEKHLMAMNGQHKKEHDHGAQGRQLLTADECLAARLVANRDDYQAAVDWLKGRGFASYNGQGRNGIFARKPLSEVLLDITVNALPELRADR